MGAPLLVVTPWYPARGTRSLLDTALLDTALLDTALLDIAVAAAVDAAVRAGADVTVVHLVPRQEPATTTTTTSTATADDAGPGAVPVRRVAVDGGFRPGDPAGVDAVAAALADGAADLLGAAAVVHAHAAVPVAAAVARVVAEGTRLIVGEHLPSAVPLLAAPTDDALTAAWQAVLARADVVLAPSEDLARRLARRGGPGESPGSESPGSESPGSESPGSEAPHSEAVVRARFDVLPYALPPVFQPVGTPILDTPEVSAPAAGSALPATRWLLLGPAAGADTVVRALAADALAGAPTTLTVAAPDDTAPDDTAPDDGGLSALAARLGVERRLVRVTAEALAGCAVDLAVGLDPLAAADPALPAALAAGVPVVLARGAGPEDLIDEVAATGAVRVVQPGAGVVALLEAVADLRLSELPRGSLLAPWRTSLHSLGRLLARHYGETVATTPEVDQAWPRVLLVDLAGGHRNEVGRLARWLAGIGGEPIVVTAAAPPPSAGIRGAVSVDLRAVERDLARKPLQGMRRRLPGLGRSGLDRALVAYRMLRPPPTLVDAALAGPLAAGAGPSPDVDAVVAADDAGAELARRWTGATTVLPPDTDRLIAHLTAAAAARAGSVAGSATAS